MDLKEAQYKDIRERLFAVRLALEKAKKFKNKEVMASLKKEHKKIKEELAKFRLEQRESGGKTI